MKPTSEHNIFRLAGAQFLAFLIVGVPLSILPLYLHNTLGFSTTLVGLAIGLHFLTTVLFRGFAGRLADTWGGKRTVLTGVFICLLSGAPYLGAAVPGLSPGLAYALVLCGRVLLGLGHSLLGTGSLSWGFALLGKEHMGRVIAWIGIACHGGIALGAPLGLALWERWGFITLGLASCLLPLSALVCNWLFIPDAAQPVSHSARRSGGVFLSILKPGFCLALQGVGNAVISAFIVLYFYSRGWGHSGLAPTCFGLSFVLIRLLCGELPDKMDGRRLSMICLIGETAGLTMIALAVNPVMAFAGVSLTGMSCSLVYPSIGVQVLRVVPPYMRGTAVGGFTAFQDIALGLSGPLTGMLIPKFGYPSVYFIATACALLSFAIIGLFPVKAKIWGEGEGNF